MSYELHYSEINSEQKDVKLISFESLMQRKYFIDNKILSSKNDKVFLFAIEYSKSLSSIYIFDQYVCISNLKYMAYKYESLYFFEYESYEEAYKAALDMKSAETDLAYNN
tara:strand:- start:187 stop:516 length:330 start_codon:yes stop_codon:yes gene_type:complete